MILLIDNYDSFVHNLARYFEQLGQETAVVRNDRLSVGEIEAAKPDAIVISPGPKGPREAGCCIEVVERLHRTMPILGVCLGHQVIVAALGGTVVPSGAPVHGRMSLVHHDGQGIFAGMPIPFAAGRYHSLVVLADSLPPCLRVSAMDAQRVVMAVCHEQFPVVGVQFHPESVLTEQGHRLLANFCRMAGLVPLPVQWREPCFEGPPPRPFSPTATPVPF